ncbi:MAG TPA: PhzF family phenazine biosynthesis protein [Gemmatimonadales bacterium]|nr:PhzF family phenazine biosynthesis protein [Gemmatimonadales bacterium]
MPQPITVVDAFTSVPFTGNSAAICILSAPRDDRWMQAVAREMNLADTAYLLPEDGGWQLRWFTPTVEVDLCGHATLASAHVLWDEEHADRSETLSFHTRSGVLTACHRGDWITLNFPSTPPMDAAAPPTLAPALGVPIVSAWRTPFDWMVEVDSETTVRALDPDLAALARLGGRGVIVTSRASSPDYDFVSRFFAPAVGIAEDPVTGSAHCALGPLWGRRLGRDELTGRQASARGGIVRVALQGDRVLLSGQAITTLRAELLA